MKHHQFRRSISAKLVGSFALLLCFTLNAVSEIRTAPIRERQFVGQWAGYIGDMDYHFLEIQIRDSWIVRAISVDDQGRVVEYQVDVDVSKYSDGVIRLAMKSQNPRLFDHLELRLDYKGERLIGYQVKETSSGWSTSGALYNVKAFHSRLEVAREHFSHKQRAQSKSGQ